MYKCGSYLIWSFRQVCAKLKSRPIPIIAVALFGALPAVAEPPPGQWTQLSQFSDEFSGPRVDRSKWLLINPHWRGRLPGFFLPSNVEFEDGEMRIHARAEAIPALPKGFHTYTTASVQSRIPVLYGFFEIRCKPMNSLISSSFWFNDNDGKLWTEIDVFEISGGSPKHDRDIFMHLHVHRSPSLSKPVKLGKSWRAERRLADEFNVYALEWRPDVIRWYFNGKVIRESKNDYWHQPLYMMIDSETMPDWFGLPDPATLPAVYRIDYIRSWQHPGDITSPDKVPRALEGTTPQKP